MGLIARIRSFVMGQTGRLDRLAEVLTARFGGAEGAVTLGLQGRPRAGFDRAMDALNRLPRPLMALGTLALIVAALIDPVWFAGRMTALAQVPEPLWWVIGAIVSLFFGARFQTQGQQFEREIVGALTAIAPPDRSRDSTPLVADTGADARLTLLSVTPAGNAALQDWLARAA